MMPAATRSEAGRGARVREGGGAQTPSPVALELPAPPSVNEIWKRSKRGIIHSKTYDDWLGHAGWVLRAQKPGRIHGPVLITLSVERRNLAADIDNRVKAILDLLVACKVIDDDKHVVGFAASWAPGGNNLARVLIIPAAPVVAEFHLSAKGTSGGWFLRPSTTEDNDHAVAV